MKGHRCRQSGFTLIELVVVTALISLMLFMAVPRFQVFVSADDAHRAARWLMMEIPLLKNRAVQEQKDFLLNFDFDQQLAWVTRDDMTEEEQQAAAAEGYRPPEAVRWSDLEFAGGPKISTHAAIRFYHQGYSDRVLIHLQDDSDRRFSVLVEPFLPSAQFYDRYVDFDE
jgi:prepilin-type N-terminal cleavage/methylation domain-containing protein